MIQHLASMAAHYLAAAPTDAPAPTTPGTVGPKINTTGVLTWILTYAVPILLALIGLGMLGRTLGGHGQTRQQAATVTQIVIALGVMAGGTALFAFASGLVHLTLGS